jgi:nitrogen fixation NifU-like protein
MTPRDAKTLYQELILDHGKAPRNEGPLAGSTHDATAKNPLCGDRVTVHLQVEGDLVLAARFEARGCMIARASASILTELVVGKTVKDVRALVPVLESLVTPGELEGADATADTNAGSLEPLRGVREFPARRACVTLAWHALESALRAPLTT